MPVLYLWGSRLRQLSRLLRRYFLSKVHRRQKRTNQVEALVTKAAALIDGKAAFADLRKKDSESFPC